MRSTEDMLDDIENANGSDGPDPAASIEGDLLRGIGDAVEARDAAQRVVDRLVGQARTQGVSWTMLARVLNVTRQAVAKRYNAVA